MYITDIKVSLMSNINVESCKYHTKKKAKPFVGFSIHCSTIKCTKYNMMI